MASRSHGPPDELGGIRGLEVAQHDGFVNRCGACVRSSMMARSLVIVLDVCEVVNEGNIPKGEGVARSVYVVLSAVDKVT
jgi:hypothetical protein